MQGKPTGKAKIALSRLLVAGDGEDIGAASALGFEAVILPGPPQDEPGLPWIVDVEIDRFAIDHPIVAAKPAAFSVRRERRGEGPVDPRRPGPAAGEARARLGSPEAAAEILPVVIERLRALVAAGAAGFRILRPDAADAGLLAG